MTEKDRIKKYKIEKEERLADPQVQLAELQEQLAELQKENNSLVNRYRILECSYENLAHLYNEVWLSYDTISNATFWKITEPMRRILDKLKQIRGGRNNSQYKSLPESSCNKQNRLEKEAGINDESREVEYSEWMKKPLFSKIELEEQSYRQFDKEITFSIVVPLYNTQEEYLREMIESVQAQTYGNWELCMADGSDGSHSEVEIICRKYADHDERIKYQKLERNLGISENTNACIGMSTGDYIALLDHDDILHPAALHEMMTAICEKNADFIYTDEATFLSSDIQNISAINFKPDYAPDSLRAVNYICHFTAFKRALLDETGLLRKEFDGSQDHDLVLRLTSAANNIVHIPEVLYYWRAHQNSAALSVDAKENASDAGIRAVSSSIRSLGYSAKVYPLKEFPTVYRIKYELKARPLISIIIPTSDHYDDLKKCLCSILEKTTYSNYEIILIENNSKDPKTFAYYDSLKESFDNIKIVTWEGNGGFNYSSLNNYGIDVAAEGDYYLLLNNDTEVITPSWIKEMLMYAQREDVGAVGAKLYFPDDTIQHAGVIIGLGGVAGHAFTCYKKTASGYMKKLCYSRNVSAVTGACVMIRKDVWDSVGGLDEKFEVGFNDIDLCMRIRKKGYLIVWTPYAELYHYESKSRGYDVTPEKIGRSLSEIARFKARWAKELKMGDPYYNPNLTLKRIDYSLKDYDE